MPPWQREQLPLLFANDELVWVPGLGMACGWQAAVDEEGLVIRWSGSPLMGTN